MTREQLDPSGPGFLPESFQIFIDFSVLRHIFQPFITPMVFSFIARNSAELSTTVPAEVWTVDR
jgi:hypothetical protein